jgi:uncharacterized membrane protein
MVDLALLGLALSSPSTERGKVAAATAAVACVTALDVLCAKQLQPRGAARSQNPAVLTATVAVNRPAHELYAFWRDPNRLSRVFEHVQVRASGDTRARWQLRGARGASWDWETELHSEVPGQRLAWRSVEGSQVQSDGTVEFLPLAEGRGTQVRVSLEYRLASGPVAAFARVFSALPGTVLRQELRRFKQLLETGEIPTTAGQPTGRRSVLSRRLP